MLLSRLERLPWQLTCLLFASVASVASATISPSNTSTGPSTRFFDGTLSLTHVEGDDGEIAQLVPLTRQAASKFLEGSLYNTNFSNLVNISDGEIAYISCNPGDYSGNVDAQRVFDDTYNQANIAGVILYSTQTDYCEYTPNDSQDLRQNFSIYSMTDKQDSAMVRNATQDLPAYMKYFVEVEGPGDNDNNNNSAGSQQQNPLGPSPSTAVAMIILYSITGIITALFLVIIITGAVRAHRHPERYGPRNVLGRPRQSRARGLGRAILDTIPIVKFGEKEPAKPTDVELGSVAETRDVDGVSTNNEAQVTPTATAAVATDATSNTAGTTESTEDGPREAQHEGIAPAQPLAGGAAIGTDDPSPDDNLGCSICTEDFEKGQDLRVLPCDHKFHPECVDPWLLNVSGTCPLCRVDLHPVTSHDSDTLAPPLNPEAEPAHHRRRTAFLDIISLRHRPNASAEERITALRRLREQRRNHSGGDVTATQENVGQEDVRDHRSRRLSERISGVFTGRPRRERREGADDVGQEQSGAVSQSPPSDQNGGWRS